MGAPRATGPAHAAPQAGPRAGGAGRAGAHAAPNEVGDGRIALGFLDASGFAPGQPVGCAWARAGGRKRVPDEPPQGRRYSTTALHIPAAPDAAFDRCGTGRRHLDATDPIASLGQRPATWVPLVSVLDTAGLHRNAAVRGAPPSPRTRNGYFADRPPYAPELNAIEPGFRAVKHLDLSDRCYVTVAEPGAAVDAADARIATKLLGRCEHQSRLAA